MLSSRLADGRDIDRDIDRYSDIEIERHMSIYIYIYGEREINSNK